jgi:preprotein translocase subunit SecD
MNVNKDLKTGKDQYEFVDASGKVVSDAKEVIKKAGGGQRPIITGADLLPQCRATIGSGQQIIVELKFNPEGTVKFRDFTRKHVDEIVAVVFDGRIISAPMVASPVLRGEGVISGGFADLAEATSFADRLNSGALPVPLKVVGGPSPRRGRTH